MTEKRKFVEFNKERHDQLFLTAAWSRSTNFSENEPLRIES